MKRVVLLLAHLLLALSLMNYGFARWSGTLYVKPAAQTDRVSWGFARNLFMQSDDGPDRTCDPGLENVRTCPEGKDVCGTVYSWGDTGSDGDDIPDRIDLVVSNAYPGYYNKIICGIRNFGEVPVNVEKALLGWEGQTHTLERGRLYYLCSGGEIVEGDAPENALFEMRWSTGGEEGVQDRGKIFEGCLEFHVLPCVSQNSIYNFSLTIAATADGEPGGSDDPEEPGGQDDPDDPGGPGSPPGEGDEQIDVPDEPDVAGPPEGVPPGEGRPAEPVTPPDEGRPGVPAVKGKFPLTGGNVVAVVYTGVVLIGLGIMLRRRDG